MRVLGLSGSLRHDSFNTKLLRAAAQLLPPDVELVIYEGLRAIPPFDQDEVERPPAAVRDLSEAIEAADAVLVATPEYNHSLPGQLKNAIDWISRPLATSALRNKPAAVMGASTSMFGAVWAQAEMRKVLAATGARVIDRELPVARAAEQFDVDGRLVNRDLRAQLGEILTELRAEVAPNRARPLSRRAVDQPVSAR